jgi:hypothetical protein
MEPGERIDFVQFARAHKTAQDCHGFPTTITAKEGPVAPAEGYSSERTFGPVVIYGEIAILEIPRERQPVLQ